MKVRKWLVPVVILLSLLFSGLAWGQGKYQKIEVFFDSISLQINGRQAPMSQSSIIYNGSVYVPLRNMSEALGAQVGWDSASRSVFLEFLQDRSNAVVKASQHGVYQYAALENNRILGRLTEHIKADDTKGMRSDIEAWGTLREIADDIGDDAMASYIDRMMSSAELLRSGWEAKNFDEYSLAWTAFKSSASMLNAHLKSKLGSTE